MIDEWTALTAAAASETRRAMRMIRGLKLAQEHLLDSRFPTEMIQLDDTDATMPPRASETVLPDTAGLVDLRDQTDFQRVLFVEVAPQLLRELHTSEALVLMAWGK
jgi:hypothetical protein